jgi:hypothetical protein
MAAIYNPKIKVVSVTKTSTKTEDKANDDFGAYEIVAEVRFTLYADVTDTVAQLTKEAREKLDHALS